MVFRPQGDEGTDLVLVGHYRLRCESGRPPKDTHNGMKERYPGSSELAGRVGERALRGGLRLKKSRSKVEEVIREPYAANTQQSGNKVA